LINAYRDLCTAELSLSAAHLKTELSLVQLYRAVGGGWQAEQPDKSSPGGMPDPAGVAPAASPGTARIP